MDCVRFFVIVFKEFVVNYSRLNDSLGFFCTVKASIPVVMRCIKFF